MDGIFLCRMRQPLPSELGHYPQTFSSHNQTASWEKDWIKLKRQALGAEAKVLIMVGHLQKEECGS